MQAATADAVLSAIAQSQNEVTQGWMRLMASAPWFAELQKSGGAIQADYYEKQMRLWPALLSGRADNVAEAQGADRPFTSKGLRDNGDYDYLRQSVLRLSRDLQQPGDAWKRDV